MAFFRFGIPWTSMSRNLQRAYGDLREANAKLEQDIVSRRRTEEALRASEERWRSLIENIPIGVTSIGSHLRYIAANPAFQRMTGYSEAELRCLSPADITHEDDRAVTEAIIVAKVAGEPNIQHVEKRYRRKDGGIIWAEVSAFPAPVAGSAPLLAAIAVDITDRKQAEEELRRSEAYLAEAQRLSHTGSFIWNVFSGKIFWSEETFRIYRYDKTAFATLDMVLQRAHPDDLALLHRIIEGASSGEKDFDYEHRLLMPDGSVKHVHVVGHAVRDESGRTALVGAVMDVTAAKQAEAALRERANLLNLTRDSVFVRDMDGVISYWNRGAEQLYGWTAADAVGKVTHQLLQTVLPVPLAEINAELQRTGLWEGELVHTKADGSRVVVASRWSLQRDEQHRPLAILESNDDITERKRAEEALRQARVELAHTTRVTALGELAASIAHEVNQPLAAIVANAGACLRWLDRGTPNLDEARRAIEWIVKDGNRAAAVIRHVRGLVNKADTQKTPLESIA